MIGYVQHGNVVTPQYADRWPYRCSVCGRYYSIPGRCLFPFCDGVLLDLEGDA